MNDLLLLLIGRLTGWYLLLCDRTTRWTNHGADHVSQAAAEGPGVILALWHGRLLICAPHAWPQGARKTISALISQSKDGEAITAAFAAIGVQAVRGSTAKAGKDKGGAAALKEMIRILRGGDSVALTPDGPRGPRMRATPGIIQLAKLSGAAIIPMSAAVSGQRLADSWDRAAIPTPFGRGVYQWGAPIHVPRDADEPAMEAARLALEQTLNALTAEADAAVGQVTPPAADAPAPETAGLSA
ncbi:MAG: lysophospholipid acyltransferase family protein [Caulobacterales bacterium]